MRVCMQETTEDVGTRFGDTLSLYDYAQHQEGQWNRLLKCALSQIEALPQPKETLKDQVVAWEKKFRPEKKD